MLKYLIIQLADDSVSYCHWKQKSDSNKLMPFNSLKKAIVYAMKENLMVQFLYPSHRLPKEYYNIIEEVDHINIKPLSISTEGDMAVCCIDNVTMSYSFNGILTIHTSIDDLIENRAIIKNIVHKHERINIIIDNISEFSDSHISGYANLLDGLVEAVYNEIDNGRYPQINILTDRIALTSMNNCNAGIDSISVCPDGLFYVCPGFYMEGLGSVGDVNEQPLIKNKHLYALEYAPICSHCDAFQCKRCVKLNKQLTREVNTPSHQQCIMAHIERNASRKLLSLLHKEKGLFNGIKIPYNNCLDPFEKRQEWEE